MTDFSISQFKQYVANLINAAGLDSNNNGVIETKNGELAKVLSNFGVKESQIGDLLEKSDTSNNTKRASDEKPWPNDVHKHFIEAQKKYDTMTEEQKYNVRQETMKQIAENYDKLQNSFIQKLKNELGSLTNQPNDNITDGNELKTKVIEKILTYAKSAYENMSENIAIYDNAFGEYDLTYRSPYEVKSSGVLKISNLADICMTKVAARINNFLSIKPSSMGKEEYVKELLQLIADVNNTVKESNDKIESTASDKLGMYQREFEDSMNALADNTIRQWVLPLDGTPHEPEPDTIAIKGAPIEKTFTDVVNNTSITGIDNAKDNDNQTKDGKFLKDGKVFIRKNGQVYDLNGNKVE